MAATLRIGARGPEVSWLQQVLNAAGYYLEVDSNFGGRTQAALASWQGANMYAWTFERGALDDATRAALKEKFGTGERLNFPGFRWDTTLLGGTSQPVANMPGGGGGFFGMSGTTLLLLGGALVLAVVVARKDDY